MASEELQSMLVNVKVENNLVSINKYFIFFQILKGILTFLTQIYPDEWRSIPETFDLPLDKHLYVRVRFHRSYYRQSLNVPHTILNSMHRS